MAHSVIATTLEEGPRNLIKLVNIVGDGSSGSDETNTEKRK
jgi:hypothetical protein